MDNRKTVLEVNDLVVSFSMYKKGFRKENLEVIHSLSIDVKEKEIVAIVGSSGSGKSLLASAILGLLPGNASTSGCTFNAHENEDNIAFAVEELGLLETVEGFGRLVHSIGVSVETDNQNEQIEFVFQMYGKQDLYGGGTNLKVKLTGDGMERKIYLSDYKWTPDDDIPGQIKFIFNTQIGRAHV